MLAQEVVFLDTESGVIAVDTADDGTWELLQESNLKLIGEEGLGKPRMW